MPVIKTHSGKVVLMLVYGFMIDILLKMYLDSLWVGEHIMKVTFVHLDFGPERAVESSEHRRENRKN